MTRVAVYPPVAWLLSGQERAANQPGHQLPTKARLVDVDKELPR